nr:FRAS1-related extracellular matrix protein 1-like [Labrus bergylta]XP_020516798.1 FRAS1-related extracellular matrix protein 1-like [Labrus bergylta]
MTWLWKFAGRKPFWIGLSGGPGRWMWADGRSVSFSRLRGAPPGSSESDVGSDCVLVETPRSWISTSCSPETQHTFICSSSAHTH